MSTTKVKVSSLVKYQLPEFVRIEYPLVEELLKEYYNSLESSFAPYDLIRSISDYIKIDTLSHLSNDFILYEDINDFTSEIILYSKSNNLKSLPRQLGFIEIDEEIILYKNSTITDDNQNPLVVTVDNNDYFAIKLLDCARGFSGITDLTSENVEDELVFETSKAIFHLEGSEVSNLSVLFFDEFLKKIKFQFLPGFSNRELAQNLNQSTFIKQSRDFYSSKGSDSSFKILFRALYDKNVNVIKPSEFVIEPSISQYRVVRKAVVERILGNPEDLLNRTLYQDKTTIINSARGTVSNVEKIFRDSKEYFVISIDDGYERDINYRGTLFSSFSVHPKTTVVTPILKGDTFIDVDSTVSFASSGNLIIYTSAENETERVPTVISYESKSLTQFFGCKTVNSDSIQIEFDSGVEIYDDNFAYGIIDPESENLVKIRITGILSDFETPENTILYQNNDPIKIKNLGFDSKNPRDNDWIYNIPLSYDITGANVENAVTKEFTIEFSDTHRFVKSDSFSVDNVDGLFLSIVSIPSETSLVVRFFRPDNTIFDLTESQIKTFTITKQISKALVKNYPDLNIFNSNIQNTYIDDNHLYVASQSLPSYADKAAGGEIELDVTDGSVVGTFYFGKQVDNNNNRITREVLFEGQTLVDYEYFVIYDETGPVQHPFFTGDAVVFRSLDGNSPIPDGVYFIKEFRSTSEVSRVYGIKLSKSRSNLINRQFVSASEESSTGSCILQFFDSSIVNPDSEDNFQPKKLDSQRLIKKISDPINLTTKQKTLPGQTGMFINGVELTNYKSKDNVYFGSIDSITVTAGGSEYDIINQDPVVVNDAGGALVNYNSRGGNSLVSNGLFVVFGAVGGQQLFINQTGGSSLNIEGSTLNLGSDEVTFGGIGGDPIRINGAIVSLGGVGGTRLYTGGSGGTPVVINGEKLTVGNVGRNAVLLSSIKGSLKQINIIDPGFNYVTQPVITITGGNGVNAKAIPNLSPFTHEVFFDALEDSGFLNIDIDQIGFSTYHKFLSGEEVIYKKGITNSLPGLSNNTNYFVSVIDPLTVTLHTSSSDAIVGVNTVNITDYSNGRHFLSSVKSKRKVTSITIENPGENYQTKLTTTSPNNISLVDDVIKIINHGYKSGEKVIHYSSQSEIGGLEKNTSYYVTVIDKDRIKLSKVSINEQLENDFYFKTRQFVKLTSVGSGILYFNYEPIKVEIKGVVGVTTTAEALFEAELQPIFRGSVESFHVQDGGFNYGSQEILNYVREPEITLEKGFSAQAIPIISPENGSIQEIIVTNPGQGYLSIPDVIVRTNTGSGALVTPIINNGKIESIKVISGGLNYLSNDTLIDIIPSGQGFKYITNITPWNVNLYQRLESTNRQSSDGGVLISGTTEQVGLKYSHLFATEFLRDLIYNVDGSGSVRSDLLNDTALDKKHSPILGWAYDGNPIYGPYGFTNSVSGQVKVLKSGYNKKQDRNNGPSVDIYPLGFFVEDYEFKDSNNGDLDEQNGRYCITPDFPTGTYAYFATVDDQNNFEPTFPFVIGNSFESQPIDFNFDRKSNQFDIDINQTQWIRNVNRYNLKNKNSRYPFIKDSNSIQESVSKVEYASPGQVEDVSVIFGGNRYKINDKITFENKNTDEKNSTALVTQISGVDVFSVLSETIEFQDKYEFEKDGISIVGFGTGPHGFSNNDLVSTITPIERIVNSNIEVTVNKLNFTETIEPAAATGNILWVGVTGNLSYPTIRENDFYESENEIVKVLNVDKNNSRIRISREQFGTSGITTFTSGMLLTEKPRKFKTTIGIQTNYQYKSNYQKYFQKDVASYGTSGITSTITIESKNYESKNVEARLGSIFIPNHGFDTNQAVTYNSIQGASLNVIPQNDLSNIISLGDGTVLYTIKLSEDFVGLSTVRVAISSEGDVVKYDTPSENALLYLNNVGISEYHSLTTKFQDIYEAEVQKTLVTVTTTEDHDLEVNDEITFSCIPKDTKTYTVKYNDTNRVLVINPRTFEASDVDLTDLSIVIDKHGFKTGDKIIYQSDNPMPGLIDNETYFVVRISQDKISLVESFYESQLEFPEFIGFGGATDGTISPINPRIDAIKNQTIVFDLSDSSLSFGAPNPIPAFSFDFYEDSKFQHKYFTSPSSTEFDVIKEGDIGVSASNPKVTLNLNEDTPTQLFYTLTPVDIFNNPLEKQGIIIDEDQINNNKINIIKSGYDGKFDIIEKTNNTFKYQILSRSENSYTNAQADLSYITSSKTAEGSIVKATVINKGTYFSEFPIKTTIETENGFDAVVYALSESIGVIKNVSISDIGFDYSSDLSIRPFAQLPTVFRLDTLYSLLSIQITDIGENYLTAPGLLLYDEKTNKTIDDVVISYELGDDFVTIERNTKNLFNRTPRIITVNNSNGIPVNNAVLTENASTTLTEIDRNVSNQEAIEDEDFGSLEFPDAIRVNNALWSNIPTIKLFLKTEYSDILDFPFELGDNVFIENVITLDQSQYGYNSERYNYSSFTVIRRDPKLGGSGAFIELNFTGFLDLSLDEPAESNFFAFDSFLSTAARAIPVKFLPSFETKLIKNEFQEEELIITEDSNSDGIVVSWNSPNDYIFLDVSPTKNNFKVGDRIVGQTSKTNAFILKIIDFNSRYNIDASTIVNEGWTNEKGFVGNPLQKIHDSDYYQYFSYSLGSTVPKNNWDDAVSNLNHTAGYKRFGDLYINSTPSNAGLSTSQDTGTTFGINDIIGNVSVNCYYDFDLTRELVFTVNGVVKSNQIEFNSRILRDYIESISNRVLPIDDISKNFRSDPRDTDFSVINRTDNTSVRSKKYFLFIVDRQDANTSSALIVNSIHDNVDVYLTQYGRVETNVDLGRFEGLLIGDAWNLLYFPTFADVNNYLLDFVAYEMTNEVDDLETIGLGDVATLENDLVTLPVGSGGTSYAVVGVGSTQRAAKIQLQLSNEALTEHELNEITVLHDGLGNVSFLEYGELVTNGNPFAAEPGIGTYFGSMSEDGSIMEVRFTPNVPLDQDWQFKSIVTSIGTTDYTTDGFLSLEAGEIRSINVSIAASDDPTPVVIGGYDSQYKSIYGFAVVTDVLNNQYKASEIQVISDQFNSYISEFGILYDPPVGIANSYVGIGTFDTELNGSRTNLLFTPIPNIPVEISMYQMSIGRF